MPLQVLLATWTGQTDFVLQTPFANRDRLEVQTMVGDLSGEALVRATLHGRQSFSTLVASVHNTLLEARFNAEIPLQLQAKCVEGSPNLSDLRVRLGMPIGLTASAKDSTPQFAGLQTSPFPLKVTKDTNLVFFRRLRTSSVIFSCLSLRLSICTRAHQHAGGMHMESCPTRPTCMMARHPHAAHCAPHLFGAQVSNADLFCFP